MVTSGNVGTSLSLQVTDLLTNISLHSASSYSTNFPVTLIGTMTVHSNDPDGFKIDIDGAVNSDNFISSACFLRAGVTGAQADQAGEYAKVEVSLTETANTQKGINPDLNDVGTYYEVGSLLTWTFSDPTKATVDLDYDIRIDVSNAEFQSLLVDTGGSIYTCTLNVTLSDL